MIKFFRKIRQNLLIENKTSKYFKYAIGEIVLVVIGILIALQINNWNDHQKNLKYKKEIILLIDQNLKSDSIAISKSLNKSKIAINYTIRLLEEVKSKNYADSLNFWMGKIIRFERFKSQSSAFEVLKSKGIDIIEDNELQLALISFYDQSLFNIYQSLEDVEQSFQDDWMPVLKEEMIDYKWDKFCKPINSEKFFEKSSTITLFKLYNDNREGGIFNLESALSKISEIRQLNKKYIND